MAARKPVTFEIPDDARRDSCRSCGKAIAWILTAAKKRMPVELDTKESHFAHCPAAKDWRGRGRT